MAHFFKRLLRRFVGDYACYRICGYRCNGPEAEAHAADGLRLAVVEREDVEDAGDGLILDQMWYFGEGARAYACMEDSRVVALCFFWWGARYRQRNFWPLAEYEAKLVQLVVLPQLRGRGIAGRLVRYAANDMCRRGTKRLYARIWWSNTPSLRAFQRAGWIRVATVVEIHPFGRRAPLRFTLPGARFD